MPRNTRTPRAPLRQRVTWEDATFGELEILEDTFTQTRQSCATCDRRGVWVGGGPTDGSAPDFVICAPCGTVQRYGGPPEPAEGFWITVVRQLQIAEGRAA